MKKLVLLMAMALVVLLAVPVVSTAFNCGEGTCKSSESCCNSNICCPAGHNLYCSGSNTCYSTVSAAKADCGDNYTVCVSPASSQEKESETPNIVIASLSDNDQACHVRGKIVAYCSRLHPYYNVFSGECYSTLENCKTADGDFSDVPGYGGCVRCGR